MQKSVLIVVILIVLAIIVVGIYYFLNNKVEEESSASEESEATKTTEIPELGNLAPEANIGMVENPLADVPQTNPLEDVPNPFEGGYENPFEE